jgi:hypothetical protein
MLDPDGEILFPGHSRWPEFIARLSDKVGDGCSRSLSYSVIILYDMGGFDVAHTIEHFRNCSMPCDCKVLLRDACRVVFSPPPRRAAWIRERPDLKAGPLFTWRCRVRRGASTVL